MRAYLLGLLSIGTGLVILDACGSRTGLPADEEALAEDAGSDVVVRVPDAGRDAMRDVGVDAPDALPPIDAAPLPDVNRNDCPDADATLVYLISDSNQLMSFYPPALEFKTIGTIACPASPTPAVPNPGPFSMAVDRKGKAYVVFTNGQIFEVSTATAACVLAPYTPGQQGFNTFGMGFVSNTGGPDETLFVAQDNYGVVPQPSKGLGSIDVKTFQLSFIGPFTPTQTRVEFTGTGDGRLFGYTPEGTPNIMQIDKTNGNIVASDPVTAGAGNDAFAFAYWGGDFWIFTGSGTTTVYRYRPADKSTTSMTTAPALIVGAGVSTCAPQ